MEQNTIEKSKINHHHQVGNGRVIHHSSNNNNMSTSRVLVGNGGTNHKKVGAPPAIPTSSREAQLHYYPWKATNTGGGGGGGQNNQMPSSSSASMLRQPFQYSAVSSNNNTSSFNHQPTNSATPQQQPVSFVVTTKPSSFAVVTSTPSDNNNNSLAAETYENVPTTSPNASSVPFLSFISSPHTSISSTSRENFRRGPPVTTGGGGGSSTMVSLGQERHALSTVPPVAMYTGNDMPARLFHHHHHHHHLHNLLGSDFGLHPNTSATFLSSSKDARVGFHSGNTPPPPPSSPTRRDSFDNNNMPIAEKSGDGANRTSRGSVAERVLWFEGFPQAAPILSSNPLLTSLNDDRENLERSEAVQVVHYTTHDHRPDGSGTALVRSRSRRTAASEEDRFGPNLTETRTIPSGSSLPPYNNFSRGSGYAEKVPNITDIRFEDDFRLSKPNGAPRTSQFSPSNFHPSSFSSSSGIGLHEATFPLITPQQALRAEQHRVVPISLETVPSSNAAPENNYSPSQTSTTYQQQLPNNSHPRLQQSVSVIVEQQQPQLSSLGSRKPAGPGGIAAASAQHSRSQSIPALTSSNLLPQQQQQTLRTPSPYLASYKRQHDQLQRTGLQQILDSLDFNKLIDEVHGRAFGDRPSLLSALGPSSPISSAAPSSPLQPPTLGTSSLFNNNPPSPPSWATKPFHQQQQQRDQNARVGGQAKEAPILSNDDLVVGGPPPPPPRRLSSAARSLMLQEEHWPFSTAFGSLLNQHHTGLLQPPNIPARTSNNANKNAVERTIPILVSDGPATPLRTAASRNKTPPPPSAVAAAVAAAAKQKLAASTPTPARSAAAAAPATILPILAESEVIAPSPSTLLAEQQQHHEQHERVLPTSMPTTSAPAITSNNAHHLHQQHHNTLSSALKEATGTAAPVAATVPVPVSVPVDGGRQLPHHAPLTSSAAALHVPIPTPNSASAKMSAEKTGKLHVIPTPAAAVAKPTVPFFSDNDTTPNGKQPSVLLSDQHHTNSVANNNNYNVNSSPAAIKSHHQPPTVAVPAAAAAAAAAAAKTAHYDDSQRYHPYTTTTAAGGKSATARYSSHNVIIPRFYYPRGKPMASDVETEFNEYVMREKLQRYFQGRHELFTLKDMAIVAKVVQVPHYWKAALFKAFGGVKETDVVTEDTIISTWKRVVHQNFDEEARFLALLAKPGTHHLEPSDFALLIQDIVEEHPGLNILKEAPEFHARYINTVISRIYFEINRSWSGKITLTELRRSKLMQVLRVLEKENDINLITDFFSYEHFYVIYCKFWELDQDHDLIINREDLARHHEGAMNPLIVDRIFSGAVTRGEYQKRGQMNYPEFVWFLLAEEDKRNPRSIEYWFRCMDLDGDGFLTLYELEYFYARQAERMKELGLEPLSFCDIATQMFDMIKPKTHPRYICLTDLKRNVKLTPIFFDTFTNLEKYILHEHRDPFANSKHLEDPELEGLSDWCKYAAEEYEYLVSEEAASQNSSANNTPSATPTNFTMLTATPSTPTGTPTTTDESLSLQPISHSQATSNVNSLSSAVLNSAPTEKSGALAAGEAETNMPPGTNIGSLSTPAAASSV